MIHCRVALHPHSLHWMIQFLNKWTTWNCKIITSKVIATASVPLLLWCVCLKTDWFGVANQTAAPCNFGRTSRNNSMVVEVNVHPTNKVKLLDNCAINCPFNNGDYVSWTTAPKLSIQQWWPFTIEWSPIHQSPRLIGWTDHSPLNWTDHSQIIQTVHSIMVIICLINNSVFNNCSQQLWANFSEHYTLPVLITESCLL